MVKTIILIAVIYFVYQTIKSSILKDTKPVSDKDYRDDSSDVMIKDPQCGVYFPLKDGIPLKKGNETLYFCSEKCRDEYKKG